MRKIEIDLWEILDLVASAEDYGFADDVLLSSLAEFTGSVSDQEIQEFADSFLTPASREQGYGEEDRDAAVKRVTEWRDEYAK